MGIRIIDNRKVQMTDDEFTMYNRIVKSYTTPTNDGESLFQELFETDENGIIMFLRPPSKRQTSFEVFLFLIALQSQQHLRLFNAEVNDVCTQMKTKMAEMTEISNQMNEKLKELAGK